VRRLFDIIGISVEQGYRWYTVGAGQESPRGGWLKLGPVSFVLYHPGSWCLDVCWLNQWGRRVVTQRRYAPMPLMVSSFEVKGWRVRVCWNVVRFFWRWWRHRHDIHMPPLRPWPTAAFDIVRNGFHTVIFLGPVSAERIDSFVPWYAKESQ
jgi:hypothetical protein